MKTVVEVVEFLITEEDMKTYFPVYWQNSEVTLTNVFYVEEKKASFLGYAKVTDKNAVVSKRRFGKIYYLGGRFGCNERWRIIKKKGYVNDEKFQANIRE